MDLGTFEHGMVEGSKGGIMLRELRGGTVVFHLEDRGLLPRVSSDLKEWIDKTAATFGKTHEKVSGGIE